MLRKDFIVDAWQVFEARAIGADCILLIAAVPRRRASCADLEATARALGMAVLVEVHDERRARAGAAPATPLVGINNRNLRTFEVVARHDAGAAAARCRADRLLVTESGILRAGRRRAGCATPASMPSWSARRSCARADPGAALAEPVRVKASDLDAAFASLPPAWARRAARLDARAAARRCAACVAAVSGDRADRARRIRCGRCGWSRPRTVKVVVIGQDPYPTAGHADGLAFSAGRGRPRSLARIFEVLAADRPGFEPPEVWRLDDWARAGVLLLNPVLTVEVGRSGSHLNCGWQALTRRDRRGLVVDDRRRRRFCSGVPRRRRSGPRPSPGRRSLVLRPATRRTTSTARFMSDGSHFEATADLVDWWAIGREQERPRAIVTGSSRRGARVAKGGRL